MLIKVVLDTNILVSAFCSADGASRAVLRLAFSKKLIPIISVPLFLEYEDVLSRHDLMSRSPLDQNEREDLFNDFLSLCQFVEVYFTWRPNLRDEADNFVVETSVAAGVVPIITYNLKDFQNHELLFPSLSVIPPAIALTLWS